MKDKLEKLRHLDGRGTRNKKRETVGAGFGCKYEEASSIFPHVRRDRDRHTYTLYTEMPINSLQNKSTAHTPRSRQTHTLRLTHRQAQTHTPTLLEIGVCGHR